MAFINVKSVYPDLTEEQYSKNPNYWERIFLRGMRKGTAPDVSDVEMQNRRNAVQKRTKDRQELTNQTMLNNNKMDELQVQINDENEAKQAKQAKANEKRNALRNLQNSLANSQAQANRANNVRYAQMLGETYSMGKEQKMEIDRNAQKVTAQSLQSLIARGLGNSTITGSIQSNINESAQNQRNDVAERLKRLRISLISSRTDLPPNTAMYSNIAEKLGFGS